MTMTRQWPDPGELLREVLEAGSGVECGPDVPPDLRDVAPRFTCYRAGGQGVQMLDHPVMHLIAWGRSYLEARDLAETGRVLIFQAWRGHYSSALGRVGRVVEISGPSELGLANQPNDVHRFDADYRVNIRPALP